MNRKIITLKYATMITTLLSAVFLFFDWFTLSIPVLESFLESSSFSVSFFTLPSLIEENALGLITRLGGKSTSIMALLLCGVLKYMCVLSAGLGLCGIYKLYRHGKMSRFIFSSQVVALAMQVLSFLVILIINIFMTRYAGLIADAMNVQEGLLKFHFTPTLWLWLSTISAIGSLLLSNHYAKELELN